MPNFKKSPAGGPSAMKKYGKGKNPIMMKKTLPGIKTSKTKCKCGKSPCACK